jgi:hypothetical protein
MLQQASATPITPHTRLAVIHHFSNQNRRSPSARKMMTPLSPSDSSPVERLQQCAVTAFAAQNERRERCVNQPCHRLHREQRAPATARDQCIRHPRGDADA